MNNQEKARKIADELDRLALLEASRADRPLTDAEIEPVVEAIASVLKSIDEKRAGFR